MCDRDVSLVWRGDWLKADYGPGIQALAGGRVFLTQCAVKIRRLLQSGVSAPDIVCRQISSLIPRPRAAPRSTASNLKCRTLLLWHYNWFMMWCCSPDMHRAHDNRPTFHVYFNFHLYLSAERIYMVMIYLGKINMPTHIMAYIICQHIFDK